MKVSVDAKMEGKAEASQVEGDMNKLRAELKGMLLEAENLHAVCAAQGGMIALLERRNDALESQVKDLETLTSGGVDMEDVKERVSLMGDLLRLKADRSEVLGMLDAANLSEIRERIARMREEGDETESGPLAMQLLQQVSVSSGIAEVMAAYYCTITLLETELIVCRANVTDLSGEVNVLAKHALQVADT